MALTIPNDLVNATTADASKVQANFDAVESWGNALHAAPSVTKLVRTTNIVLVAYASSDVTWETQTDPDGWWGSGTTLTVPDTGIYALSLLPNISAGGGDIVFEEVSGKGVNISVSFDTSGDVCYLTSGDTYKVTVTAGGSGMTLDEITIAIVQLGVI